MRWETDLLLDNQNKKGLHDVKNCRRINTVEVRRTSIRRKDNDYCFLGLVRSVTRISSTKDVTSASYFGTLIKLQTVIKEKCRRLFSRGIILYHDNASSHTTCLTQTLVQNMKRKILKHSSYSPKLGVTFSHFPLVERRFGRKAFQNRRRIEERRESSKLWRKNIRVGFLSASL